MSGKSRTLINAEINFIRKMLEQNLELGLNHDDIIEKLKISRATYYRHIKRIMEQDSKIWDEVYMDSAKYMATRLIQSLLDCANLCKEIMSNPNNKADDRMAAARTLCEAETNIFKLVNEGPVFKVSITIKPDHTSPYKDSN